MKKILILCNSSGGLLRFRGALIAQMLRKAWSVTAVLPDTAYQAQLQDLGCKTRIAALSRRGLNPLKDFNLLRRYIAIVREEKPDLVVTYTIKPNIYGGLACRLLAAPYAANITGLGTAFEKPGPLKTLVCMLYKTALRRVGAVFFENTEDRALFVRERLVRPERTVVLHGAGVDLAHFQLQDYPAEAPEFNFLFIGRIMKEKGVEELFSAMRRLRAEGLACRLTMLGGSEENYAAQIERCTAEGWLDYRGHQDDIRPFIARAHCYVLPSYHEGMANTNLECAASGRPIITSDIPGCREAVLEGVSGLLCAPRDPESLYAAMKRMQALSREERQRMGLAGRRHMEEVFDKKMVVAETLEKLEELFG